MTNYYHVLGVGENASEAEIKVAFKKKALQYHPDKNDGDQLSEEKFKMINTAYQALSNPYERARYDLKLKFGDVTFERPAPPAYRSPYARPKYARTKIDHKTNDLATFWAFGISLGIAAVVMTGMHLFNLYSEHQRNLMLDQRREIFDQARDYEATGQVAASLSLLETLGFFHKEEADMKVFQEEVLDELLQSGTANFYRNNYQQALADFQLFEDFSANKRLSFELLFAETHMMAGNYEEAVGRFNKIIVNGNNTIENNIKVAWIYREGIRDYDKAMNYYDRASKMAINGYKAIYGEAYPLILNPRIIPPAHFDIFHGMAQTFYYQENYDRAIRTIKWNAIMWPDYPENYVLRGKALEALGKTTQACEEYEIAVEKGWDDTIRCQ